METPGRERAFARPVRGWAGALASALIGSAGVSASGSSVGLTANSRATSVVIGYLVAAGFRDPGDGAEIHTFGPGGPTARIGGGVDLSVVLVADRRHHDHELAPAGHAQDLHPGHCLRCRGRHPGLGTGKCGAARVDVTGFRLPPARGGVGCHPAQPAAAGGHPPAGRARDPGRWTGGG